MHLSGLAVHLGHQGVGQLAFARRIFLVIPLQALLIGQLLLALDVAQRPAVAVAAHQPLNALPDGLLADTVQVHVRGGVDPQAQIQDSVPAEALLQEAPDMFSEIPALPDPARPLGFQPDLLAQGRLGLLLADEAHLGHAPQHIGLALLGVAGIHIRGVAAGRFGDSCQEGGLGKSEILHMLGKVFPGGGLRP